MDSLFLIVSILPLLYLAFDGYLILKVPKNLVKRLSVTLRAAFVLFGFVAILLEVAALVSTPVFISFVQEVLYNDIVTLAVIVLGIAAGYGVGNLVTSAKFTRILNSFVYFDVGSKHGTISGY